MNTATPETSVQLSPTDRSLVVLLRDGDEAAANLLYDRYARRLHGLVRAKLGEKLASNVEPDDIVQSVFANVFLGVLRGNYEAPNKSTLWNLIAVIAINKLKSKALHHSAQRRDASRNVPLQLESDELERAIDHADGDFFMLCVQESLELLRPSHREILDLRIKGHSIDEIHSMTGRTRRTIERSLQKSRKLLADSLLNS